ncbi:UDPGT domain-containing protein [Cephalotus follicularis]|uniref:Glycosyltransferase n=1 Tax=Cephalotus follicularis TaxID=3775 RepID=A0A1Q3C8A7_CEPFO|nr:UDPGT domain-containing protein [Cephalotus follicularis]
MRPYFLLRASILLCDCKEKLGECEREMESKALTKKPHAVCVPLPATGHINPMLKLAKLLYHKGFHITFVYTEYNHKRLLKSRCLDSFNGLPNFRFETIPHDFPPLSLNAIEDFAVLLASMKNCQDPFKDLLLKLNGSSSSSSVPPVTCIVSDMLMNFTVDAAVEFSIPVVFFWISSSCSLICHFYTRQLHESSYTALKDESNITNGYLDTIIDFIPGVEGIPMRYIPISLRILDPDNIIQKFIVNGIERSKKVAGFIIHTYDALEKDVLSALSSMLPPVYSIGPLPYFTNQIQDNDLYLLGSNLNLWHEYSQCLEWLDSKEPDSVLYVSFGSTTIMTRDQMVEFAWGLANSKKNFLWVIRSDLLSGDSGSLPAELLADTKERSLLVNWCPQEQVLNHASIGGFLTHCGWMSNIEALCAGVPMVCWPFSFDHPTICWFNCVKWGVGMEIDNNVKRDEVERLVRELMDVAKGKEIKKKAMEWKKLAEEATTSPNGSSWKNLDAIVKLLLSPNK